MSCNDMDSPFFNILRKERCFTVFYVCHYFPVQSPTGHLCFKAAFFTAVTKYFVVKRAYMAKLTGKASIYLRTASR